MNHRSKLAVPSAILKCLVTEQLYILVSQARTRGMIQFVNKFSSQTREVNLKIGIQNSVIKYKNCIIIEHSYPTTSQTNLSEMISGEYEGNFMLF